MGQMPTAIALAGFHDFGCTVTPVILLTDDFSTDFLCLPKQWKNVSIRSLDFSEMTLKLCSF